MEIHVIGIVATLWGACMAAAPFVQAYRIDRRQSAADVSIPANLLSLSGCLIWIVWGIVSHNPPIYLV